MKVVLFCGGMGMRIREHSEVIPKPMVCVGYRPIVWNLMKYYAFHGHTDFILCLGWKGNVIKDYFLRYDECVSNDFTLEGGNVQLHNSDIHEWKITFVDTGQTANVGQRLKQVQHLVQDEEYFLANYSDGLTDLPLNDLVDDFKQKQVVASCLCVKPAQSFHLIDADEHGMAQRITPVAQAEQWMNGGFFAMTPEVFNYMQPGEDLAFEPFRRLIDVQKLGAYRYEGFWGCMDTYKEKQALDDMYARGNTPWEVWNRQTPAGEA
ncbi:MAG: sugar phosphate nucleotidyltransferase [Planctomycetota bacterium]|nr:sugar phosphate nucleotidyltransferase [Planctomycetota bacterium]MDA1179324.1 sugar phosphate nucleotidyltransferase [Planctomycetota bacterium]